MIENLIKSIETYKAMMEYQGKDFDADKTVQYGKVRKMMAEIYEEELFGLAEDPVLPENFCTLSKEEQSEIRKKNAVKKKYNTKG